MNDQKIEEALRESTFISLIELSGRNEEMSGITMGYIFTGYREIDNTIIIGHSNRDKFLWVGETEKLGYKVINSRFGKAREKKLLSITLKELGYKPIYGENAYKYSHELIKHLKILGWPIQECKLNT